MFKAPDTGFNREFGLLIIPITGGGAVSFNYGDNISTVVNVNGTTDVADDQWHRTCFTKENLSASNDAIRLFLDGSTEASNLSTGIKGHQNNIDMTLGRVTLNSLGTRYFDGRMASLIIWNTNLTDDESRLITNRNYPRPWEIKSGNIIGFWPMYGVINSEGDLSGNRNSMVEIGDIPGVVTNHTFGSLTRPPKLTQIAALPPGGGSGGSSSAVGVSMVNNQLDIGKRRIRPRTSFEISSRFSAVLKESCNIKSFMLTPVNKVIINTESTLSKDVIPVRLNTQSTFRGKQNTTINTDALLDYSGYSDDKTST